jgi:hypothetical protein
MAEPDLTFLGEQIRRMQGDLRQIRAEQLRLETDQAAMRAELVGMRADLGTLRDDMAAGFDRVLHVMDFRFEQTHNTIATNFEILLQAIQGLKPVE